MSMLPKDLEEMLGSKEEFEQAKKLDEDGDDLLGEKLNQEYQEEMSRED